MDVVVENIGEIQPDIRIQKKVVDIAEVHVMVNSNPNHVLDDQDKKMKNIVDEIIYHH